MFQLKLSILVVTFLSILITVKCDEPEKLKFLTCNPHNATAENTGCPKASNCIENVTINGVLQGFCVCPSTHTVNKNYSASDNSSQYCIEKKNDNHSSESPPTIQTTIVASTTTTTPKPSTTTVKITTPVIPTTVKVTEAVTTPSTTTSGATAKKSEPENAEEKADVKVAPAPEPHHIFGGILLSICVVVAFIGSVFVVRKYDLIDRAHGYIRNRNQQTRYNGLMENDFDDDPLLI